MQISCHFVLRPFLLVQNVHRSIDSGSNKNIVGSYIYIQQYNAQKQLLVKKCSTLQPKAAAYTCIPAASPRVYTTLPRTYMSVPYIAHDTYFSFFVSKGPFSLINVNTTSVKRFCPVFFVSYAITLYKGPTIYGVVFG